MWIILFLLLTAAATYYVRLRILEKRLEEETPPRGESQ
jgi:hypothetical protein